jgi:hypothetical protein
VPADERPLSRLEKRLAQKEQEREDLHRTEKQRIESRAKAA